MTHNNFVFNLLQIIFTLVGLGLIAGGYFAAPGSKTDDGYPLNYFLYTLGPFLLFGPLCYLRVCSFVLIQKNQKIKAVRKKAKNLYEGLKRNKLKLY